MAVSTEEKEEQTTEEKIAKSSGNETEEYSQALEDEVDGLINDVYHPEKAEGKNKAQETKEPETKDEPEKKEEVKEPIAKQTETDDIVASDGDTLETLKEKLVKSEERRKNTQSEFTKREQLERDKEKDSKAIIEGLKETIITLKTTTDRQTDTKKQEREKDKEIADTVIDLGEQFATLEMIDPDIAKPIKSIIEGLATKITGLETDLKTKAELLEKSTITNAEEAHFGKIESAHPGYETNILGTEEFETWLDGLPSYISKVARKDIEDGTAEDIVEIFTNYKDATKVTPPTDDTRLSEKEKKLKLAEGLTNPGKDKAKNIKEDDNPKIKYTRKMLRTMPQKEYEKLEADIDKEAAAGRIPDE